MNGTVMLGNAAESVEEKNPTEEFQNSGSSFWEFLKKPLGWIINYSPIRGFVSFIGIEVETVSA